MLSIRIEPAVAAAAVMTCELGVRQVDAGVEGRHRDALSVHSLRPEHGCARQRDTGLAADGVGRLDRKRGIRLDRADIRAGSQCLERSGICRQSDGVGDPERAHVPYVPFAAQRRELDEQRRLGLPSLALDLPGRVARAASSRRQRPRLEVHDDRLRRSRHRLRRKQGGGGERRENEGLAHHAVRARRIATRAR